MLLELTPISALWAVYALAALVLAALVFQANFKAANIAISLYLAQQFFATLASLVAFTATDNDVALAAFGGGAYIWLLWAPVTFAAGPLLLWGTRRFKAALVVGLAGAAPSVAVLILSIGRPDIIFAAADHSALTNLAADLILLAFLGFACTIALLAVEAFTTPFPMQRAQFALLAAALVGEGMFHAAQNSGKVLFGADFFGVGHATPAQAALSLVPFLILLAVAAWGAWFALRDPDADRRKWARLFVGFALAASLTGLASAPLVTGEEYHHPEGAFHALWDLASICLLVFAALRFQLFRIEIQAKQGLKTSIVLLLCSAVFVSAEELLQSFIENQFFSSLPGITPIVISALITAAGAIPFFGLAERLVKRLFPHVEETSDYEQQRREDLYRVAVEGALLDGNVTTREMKSLVKLRTHLGLTPEDHERIEGSVRSVLTASGASPA